MEVTWIRQAYGVEDRTIGSSRFAHPILLLLENNRSQQGPYLITAKD